MSERLASERRLDEAATRLERMQDAIADICQCGGSYRSNEHDVHCAAEARALDVWNAPADDTGRSVLR
jgi:hypothetical protein